MKNHPVLITGIIFFFLLGFHLIVLAETAEIRPELAETSDEIISSIDKNYQAIKQNVEKGTISPQLFSEAETSYVELKKYLLRSHAEVQILRIDLVTVKDSEERERTINKLSQLLKERERNKMICLDQLRAINNNSSSEPAGAMRKTPQSTEKLDQQRSQAEHSSSSGNKYRESELDIEIIIEPEDISTGQRD